MFSKASKYTIYTSEINEKRNNAVYLELRIKEEYNPGTQEADIFGSKRLGKIVSGEVVKNNHKDSKRSKLDNLFADLLTGTGIVPAQIYEYARTFKEFPAQSLSTFLEQAVIHIVQTKIEAESQELKEVTEVTTEETMVERKRLLSINMLKMICEEIGLIDILENAFDRKTAHQILSVSMFLVMTQNSIANIDNFQLAHELYCSISQDTCGRLFEKIGLDETGNQKVFNSLATLTCKDSIIGFDTTTVSTYSDNLELAEYGLNKDGDGLETVKILLSQSLTKNLPIQFELQKGHIPDVNCIENFIIRSEQLGLKSYEFVGDRGFSSQKNIELLLESGVNFTSIVSASNSWVRKHLHSKHENGRTVYENLMFEKEFADENELIHISTYGPTRFTHKDALDKEHMLHFHFFLSPQRYNQEVNDLQDKAQDLVEQIQDGEVEYSDLKRSEQRLINKCFNRCYDDTTGKDLFLYKKTNVDTMGLFCVVSSLPRSAEEALKVYNMRNQIELSFRTIKNNLDGRKPRTSCQYRLRGKVLCQMFGLIILSAFQNVLKLASSQCQENKLNDNLSVTDRKKYKKLQTWIKDQSLHNILVWYDSIDIVEYRKVNNYTGKTATKPDIIERDKLFFALFESKLKEYANSLDVDGVRIKK